MDTNSVYLLLILTAVSVFLLYYFRNINKVKVVKKGLTKEEQAKLDTEIIMAATI